jgi:hypothetical protein
MFSLARAAVADVVCCCFFAGRIHFVAACAIFANGTERTPTRLPRSKSRFLPRELFRSNFDVADDDDVFAVPLFGLVAHVRDDQSYLHWRVFVAHKKVAGALVWGEFMNLCVHRGRLCFKSGVEKFTFPAASAAVHK